MSTTTRQRCRCHHVAIVVLSESAFSSRRCREVGEDQGEGEDASTTARQQQRVVGHVTRCHCHIVSIGVVWPRIFPLSSIRSPAHVLPNHNRAPITPGLYRNTTRVTPPESRLTTSEERVTRSTPKSRAHCACASLTTPSSVTFPASRPVATLVFPNAFRKHCPRLYFAIKMVSLSGQRGGSYAALESDDAIVSRLARQDRVPWYNKPNLRSLYFLMAPTCLGAEILFG